jgi:hypothetical protein
MYNSLLFRIKAEVDVDKHRFLELFFKDWVDTVCNNEVDYKIERVPGTARVFGRGLVNAPNLPSYETFKVEFQRQEDATAMRLKGVPEEFQHYLEILN